MKLFVGYRGSALFLLIAGTFGGCYWVATVVYRVDLRPRAVLYQIIDPPENEHVGVSRRVVVRQLQVVHEQLARAFLRKTPPTERVLTQIHELIRRLEPQVDLDSVESDSAEVCPESYIGPDEGWITDNCSQTQLLKDLVEIALYYPVCNSSRLSAVLHGVRVAYPDVIINVAVNEDVKSRCGEVVANFSKVILSIATSKKPGIVWNQLISMVSTTYVLVGRDIDYFTEFSNLERQIRVLGTIKDVQAVGGAFRNTTGHWRVGCFQLDARNYALQYQDGYFVSRNECMFCDHLLGPFLTRTAILKELPFNNLLSAAVLFEDWFLNLRNEQLYVMNCPDVMYFSTDPNAKEKIGTSKIWLPLARKWELNRLTWPPAHTHVFTCKEAGLSCSDIKTLTHFYLMPPCCIEEFASALQFLHEFFSNRSIKYEIFAGSALGAVKMADLIPWDLDGDVRYYAVNHSVIEKAKELFSNHGFSLREFESPKFSESGQVLKSSYVALYTPNLYIEMFGDKSLSHDIVAPVELRTMASTKVNIHGVWVFGPPNPGLYSRNRYGHEILKHAQSWIHQGKKSSWDPYIGGHFKPCPKHHHHACLDQFPPDGSLNFKVT